MRFSVILLTLSLCAPLLRADTPLFDPARHMRISEVKPGMKGYGLSVFSGTKIEKVDVNVVGTATADTKQTSSPEKKVTWSLRDAVLLPGMKKAPRNFPLARRDSLMPNPMLGGNANDNTRLEPLVTPLMASGVPAKVLDQFGPLFEAYGFHLLQAGGAGGGAPQIGEAAQIEPGSALAAPLITGDMDLVATGTCTERLGDRVFAFGHAFNNEGPIDIPMAAGQINGIVATL